MQKFFVFIMSSLALSLAVCKPAIADEAPKFIDEFNLGGYSSAGIILQDDQAAEAAINQVSLLLTWANDSPLSFFGELELERPLAWNDDDEFGHKEGHLDLERLYFDYNLSEKVNFRGGRFLTPNSRWNLLHAAPLVWTSSRPMATTELFPEATNGAMVYGAMPFMNSAFEYKLFGELLEDQGQTNGDNQKFNHVGGVRVSLKNQSDIGVSLTTFHQKGLNAGNLRMLGIDFLTHFNNVEISGEGFQRFNSNDKNGGSGAYVQTAVPVINNWYWITRLETIQRPNEGTSERWLIGATMRVKPTQLLKLEFTGGSADQPESPRGFLTSFAFFF